MTSLGQSADQDAYGRAVNICVTIAVAVDAVGDFHVGDVVRNLFADQNMSDEVLAHPVSVGHFEVPM